jgi:hypothetical protein
MIAAILWGSLLASSPAPHAACSSHLEVLSSHATFSTKTFQGQAIERDAKIDVEVRSTSTSALSAIEVAVFLGASMAAVDETRLGALPTLRPRDLEGGGLAFRAVVPTLIPPGASRTLRIDKTELPLELELASVVAKIVDCKLVSEVGTVTIVTPAEEGSDASPIYFVIGGVLAIAAAIVIGRRLR